MDLIGGGALVEYGGLPTLSLHSSLSCWSASWQKPKNVMARTVLSFGIREEELPRNKHNCWTKRLHHHPRTLESLFEQARLRLLNNSDVTGSLSETLNFNLDPSIAGNGVQIQFHSLTRREYDTIVWIAQARNKPICSTASNSCIVLRTIYK
jgi:hypothetical protein